MEWFDVCNNNACPQNCPIKLNRQKLGIIWSYYICTVPSLVYLGTSSSLVYLGTAPSLVYLGTAPSLVYLGTASSPVYLGTALSLVYLGTVPSLVCLGTVPSLVYVAPSANAKWVNSIGTPACLKEIVLTPFKYFSRCHTHTRRSAT